MTPQPQLDVSASLLVKHFAPEPTPKPMHLNFDASPPSLIAAPGVVLDTNVVLDWLVFRHPGCGAVASAIECARVRWLVSPAMRTELDHVLARGLGARWQPDKQSVWATWLRWSVEVAGGSLDGASTRLRCTDPDDQKFIDLALAHRARWLLSRDKAVLKLARRCRDLGLEIVTPQAWRESSVASGSG